MNSKIPTVIPWHLPRGTRVTHDQIDLIARPPSNRYGARAKLDLVCRNVED